jgi:hypothetical protein
MNARRPLQNRVDPFGQLVATPARGMLLGNRGGKFYRDDRTLGRRRWASKQWIACVCAFKDRKRAVWGGGYTQLFFLDEITALAAGHRPCFECRRAEAESFRACFSRDRRLSAPQMDAIRCRAQALLGKTVPAIARRRRRRNGGWSLCRPGRRAVAVELRWLWRPVQAAGRGSRTPAYPSGYRWRSGRRLSPAMGAVDALTR